MTTFADFPECRIVVGAWTFRLESFAARCPIAGSSSRVAVLTSNVGRSSSWML